MDNCFNTVRRFRVDPPSSRSLKSFVPGFLRAPLRLLVAGTADRLYSLAGEVPVRQLRPALYVNDEGVLKLRPDLSAQLHQNPAIFAVESGAILQFFQGGVHLDVGCGIRKVTASAIGIDVTDGSGPFVARSVNVVTSADNLYLFRDETIDFISCIHSFEHYDNPKDVLREWLRVLKVGGRIGIVVPDRHGLIPDIQLSTAHKFDYDGPRFRALLTECCGGCTIQILALDTLNNGWSIDLVLEKKPPWDDAPA
ncbi:MAG: class I SAM-dependent methyltransferase [Acidobacteria bacterium]|nr:class I SAM-dependent methyltransferase [Acidobacteriota bacterium]